MSVSSVGVLRVLLPGMALAASAADPGPLAGAPLSLHPDNPRYFLWRGKPTVLVTSGEHYGAVLNLDFDYGRYLDALAADGLNLTRTFSGVYREISGSFGITDNTLAPKPGRAIGPWARSDQPGCADGGNRYDLSKWDEAYFARLRDFMGRAQARGVVVEFNLFCTFYDDNLWAICPLNAAANVNGLGDCPRAEVHTLRHAALVEVQLAFVKRVVRELNAFDNLYYEVCNEPYFNGVSLEWQQRVAQTVAAVERDLPNRHLVSMNIANGRQRVDNPYPEVSIFNYHYCVPPDVVEQNAHIRGVIGENETGFRGRADVLYRTEGWDFLVAGGALYNNLDYSFTPGHPDGSLREYASPGGGSPELRRQLAVLKRFFDGLAFVRMAPGNRVLKTVAPAELSARALVEAERTWVVYLHVPLPPKAEPPRDDLAPNRATVTLDLPAGTFGVDWISPLTGQVLQAEDVTHAGGGRELASPAFGPDLVLRVRRK